MKISKHSLLPVAVGVIGSAGLLTAWLGDVGSSSDREVEVLGAGSNRPETPPGLDRRMFSISGDVDGLYPGAIQPLVLTIRNPHAFAIRVVDLDVDVADVADGVDCPQRVVAVGDLPTPVVVARGATSTAELAVSLDADAPDACKGVQFALTYRGLAEKA